MKIPVYAWYFPNWHPDSRNNEWHGKGWTEWECVKHAAKRFDGHQLYHPLWGYENEADPAVMERKINTALQYGIDGFLWDFYWFDDGKGSCRLKALEEGFFGAKNNERMQIAFMWCNHDPIYVHPASYRDVGRVLLPGELSPQAFYDGTQYMINHCFCRENYLRIDGKLYFILWDIRKFVSGMGGVDGAKMALDHFRQRVRDKGMGEMYIATVPKEDGSPAYDELLKTVGIDGLCTYNWPGEPTKAHAWPHFPYSEYVDNGIATFAKSTAATTLPNCITVAQGWDTSARTVPSDMYENLGFPFSWITSGKNAADFERGLRAAKAFFESEQSTGHFISISTWNEWTEGNAIEPSVEDGYAYLEAIRRVFQKGE